MTGHAPRPLGAGDSPLLWGLRLRTLAGAEIRVHLLTIAWIAMLLLASLPRDALGLEYAAMAVGAWVLVVVGRDGARWIAGARGMVLVWPTGGAWEGAETSLRVRPVIAGIGSTLLTVLVTGAVMAWLGVSRDALAVSPLAPRAALAALEIQGRQPGWLAALWWVYAAGVTLTVVQLIPARPLDGGVILEHTLRSRGALAARQRVDRVGIGAGCVLVALGVVGSAAPAIGLGAMVGVLSWWDLRLLDLPTELSRGEAPRHETGPDAGPSSGDLELDRLLEKIAGSGMASLSRRELEFLKGETARRRGG